MVAGPLKVVQILPELNAGGVERGTLELARFLVGQGHQSLVISQGGAMVPQLIRDGSEHLTMKYIGEKTPRSLVHWLPLRRLFKQGRIDIIHLRSRLPAWVAYLAWKSLPENTRPYLITTFHGFYSINRYSAVMTKGQQVIAISKAIADHIQSAYHTPASKITIIHRGVDVSEFRPELVTAERVSKTRKSFGIAEDDNRPVIVLPGRMTFWKGHDVFIEALSHIRDLPWRAVCIGAMDRGSSFYNKVMRQVGDLGLEGAVKFIDHEKDMPVVYAAADIVVSAATAEAEAFGRVAVEAQAMARPIVASAHGGSLETVVDGQTGRFFTPGDAIGLSKVLAELVSNPDLRKHYGENGLKHAHSNFTTRRMCESTLSLYRSSLT